MDGHRRPTTTTFTANIGTQPVNFSGPPNAAAVDQQVAKREICTDRQTIASHGIDATTFAYPNGVRRQSLDRADNSRSDHRQLRLSQCCRDGWVQQGVGTSSGLARDAGMVAEWRVDLVDPAGARDGRELDATMDPDPIFRVCSGSTDTACTSSASGWVQLDTLNQFLDWLGNAGNTGGAPAGTTVKTAEQVAKTDDTVAPTTTILCNSAPCAAEYSGPVLVSFTATDTGSGVASTHYTTDGSPVTLSSPTYSSPFWLTAPTTVNFASSGSCDERERRVAALYPDLGPGRTDDRVRRRSVRRPRTTARSRFAAGRVIGDDGDVLHDRRLATPRPQARCTAVRSSCCRPRP